jgi:hypothetical protein
MKIFLKAEVEEYVQSCEYLCLQQCIGACGVTAEDLEEQPIE